MSSRGEDARLRRNTGAPVTNVGRRPWRLTLAVVGLVTLVRLTVLFVSPLQLYPDEAQYWLWSRDLAFGYFSKPPMVAWLIHATTVMGRDGEPFVRFSSPLLHACAALALFPVGRRLYGPWTGTTSSLLYLLTPGVALSSFVVSTDPALLACLALALWAYVVLQDATSGAGRIAAATGFGVALGLGFLSKYAVLYALIGVVAHLAFSRPARQAWNLASAAAALAAFAVIAAPNIAWNAGHGFATVAHTASNANWGAGKLFNPLAFFTFLGEQFGVFGPIPFAVLAGGAAWLAWRRRLTAQDGLLLALAMPPLVIVAAQALISRANANWAAAAYVPGAVLAAAWLIRWNARRWLTATFVSQGIIAVAILVFTGAPALADRAGLANSYKRVRGWKELTGHVIDRANLEQTASAPLSAVALDDRFFFNEAAYYGRDYFGRPGGGPPLAMWIKGAAPENQAELSAPLTVANGGRVIVVALEGRNADAMAADFQAAKGREIDNISLDLRHHRSATIFLGEGFRPAPRK